MPKYYFADLENQTINSGYTTIVIENHEADIKPLRKLQIIDEAEEWIEVEDTEAMLLAEKLGGVLQVVVKEKKGKAALVEPVEDGI